MQVPASWLKIAAISSVFLIYGCASTQVSTPNMDAEKHTQLNEFLDQASPNASLEVAESPWGSNVILQASPTYFAASGRKCRDLLIHDGPATRPGLVCRTTTGQWEAVRPIARHAGN